MGAGRAVWVKIRASDTERAAWHTKARAAGRKPLHISEGTAVLDDNLAHTGTPPACVSSCKATSPSIR